MRIEFFNHDDELTSSIEAQQVFLPEDHSACIDVASNDREVFYWLEALVIVPACKFHQRAIVLYVCDAVENEHDELPKYMQIFPVDHDKDALANHFQQIQEGLRSAA